MKKKISISVKFFAAACAMLLLSAVATSCHHSKVESAIKAALVNADTTKASFDSICSLIKADPDANRQLLTESGEINFTALQELINATGSKMRPPLTWSITPYTATQLSLTVYFERSGSMTPYDNTSCGGQLKRAVNDLINFFPSKDKAGNVTIKIVNDNIYPYSGTIDSFLQDRDIYASTANVGNAKYTDFGLIFNKILSAQGSNNVSVLVTDLIYSPENTADVSTNKIFNEENALATSVFKSHKGKSVIVHQLMGDYNGYYYPYNNKPFRYSGRRPFYILVIADSKVIDAMAASPEYASFLNIKGETNSYRFNQTQTGISFNVISDWESNLGRFRPSHSDAGELTNCENDRNTGTFSFTIAANLKALNKPESFLTDASNYRVNSQNGFKITSVKAITPSIVTGNNKAELERNTHLITVSGKFNTPRDEISITLPNEFPKWISQSTSADDTTPAGNFANTTFGLEHFLQGIYNAFSAETSNYATITIKLKK